MICGAGKDTRDGKPTILIVGLLPADLERLRRGGSVSQPLEAIDPALGPGTLVVGAVASEEEFLTEIGKRFEIGRVVRVDK